MHHAVAIADTNYQMGPKHDNARRQCLKRLLWLGAARLDARMINHGWFQLFAESATKYSARAIGALKAVRCQMTTVKYQQSLLDC